MTHDAPVFTGNVRSSDSLATCYGLWPSRQNGGSAQHRDDAQIGARVDPRRFATATLGAFPAARNHGLNSALG